MQPNASGINKLWTQPNLCIYWSDPGTIQRNRRI